jgi:4-amino-4-deoxy-L-arabinose transferase-like glycosyltransferase
VIAFVAVAGLVLRVWIYRSALGVPNSDEAVVGLMARHAMHGDVSVFFWGSSYGGPQEVLLDVPFFWIFGSGYLALRIVAIGLNAVAALLAWRVGRRVFGDVAGAAAASLLWLWPPFNLFQLTQQQSFFAANVVYCALLLLLALRIVERPDRLRAAVFGFVVGFAFWQTPHIVPVAIPVIAWTAWRAPRALRHAWAGAAGCLLGASPWLFWNAFHDWRSLGVHTDPHLYVRSLRLFVSPILPMTLGLRTPFSQQLLVPFAPLVYLAYAGAVALFVSGAVRARRRPGELLYVVAAAFPFLYAIDRRTTFVTSWPQYTVVVTPVLALLVAQAATRYGRVVALVAAATVVAIVSVQRMDDYYHVPQPLPRAPRDLAPLVSTLDRLRLDRVYADYWIAYLVDFATGERIVAVENSFRTATFRDGRAVLPSDPNVRYRPYERTVAAAARRGFVFFRRTAAAVAIVPQLRRHGYERRVVGPFVVYAPR